MIPLVHLLILRVLLLISLLLLQHLLHWLLLHYHLYWYICHSASLTLILFWLTWQFHQILNYLVFIFLLSKLFLRLHWLTNWIHYLILPLLLLLQQATHLGFLPKLKLLPHSLLILKTSLLILLVFLLFDIYRFIHTIIFLFLLE